MLRTVIRSSLMRLCLYIGIGLALLGMCAPPAQAATGCGSSVNWSIRPSLVAPKDFGEIISNAYAQVEGPARLRPSESAEGEVRWLIIDRGVGSTVTPGSSRQTALLGGAVYRQHALLPAEGDALRAEVLRIVLADLGIESTSGATLSAEDAAALEARCAKAPPAPVEPDGTEEPAVEETPAVETPAVEEPSVDEGPAAAAPNRPDADTPNRSLGLALVGVAVVGVAGYLAAPVVLPRLRRTPATDPADGA